MLKSAGLVSAIVLGVFSFTFASRNISMNHIGKGFDIIDTDPFQASKEFKLAIVNSPNWDYPYILLANLYDSYFLIKDAIENYERAISLGISQRGLRFDVYSHLGCLYAKDGDLERAKRYFNIADSISPGRLKNEFQALILMQKAEKIMQTNRLSAIPLLRQVIGLQKDWVYAYGLLAEIYKNSDDKIRAVEVYERALDLVPIKTVVLSGDASGARRGGFYFIRHPDNNGDWNLDISLPEGEYRYRFYINFTQTDEFYILDPNNNNIFTKGPGDLFNTLRIEKQKTQINFVYRTLPMDKTFINFEKEIASLKLSYLTGKYQKGNLYGTVRQGNKVNFNYYNPQAYAVWVTGSFNQWGRTGGEPDGELNPRYYWPMQYSTNTGKWELEVELDTQIYEYNYVINEKYIAKDPQIDIEALEIIEDNAELMWRPTSLKSVGEGELVEFVYNDATASRVFLIGDFNSWGGLSAEVGRIAPGYYIPMRGPDANNDWRVTIKLGKGGHRYKYAIDGEREVKIDPNPDVPVIRDPRILDGEASIVYVGKKELAEGELLGVDKNGIETVFRFRTDDRNVGRVWVVGDFNEWGGHPDFRNYLSGYYYPMEEERRGNWVCRVKLPPGTWHYVFVVNGRQWQTDPNAEEVIIRYGSRGIRQQVSRLKITEN
jgi:tetratricopeptide (TPR) repeat protein